MEDTGLAERKHQGCYSINDLMLYSAVCGLGLDAVGEENAAKYPGNTVEDIMFHSNKGFVGRLLFIGFIIGLSSGFDQMIDRTVDGVCCVTAFIGSRWHAAGVFYEDTDEDGLINFDVSAFLIMSL